MTLLGKKVYEDYTEHDLEAGTFSASVHYHSKAGVWAKETEISAIPYEHFALKRLCFIR